MTISPARPDELPAAFALLYGSTADTHVGQALQLLARGELNPGDVLVARSETDLVGAVFCQALPGAVAVIWPPRAVGNDVAVEDALTAAALDRVPDAKVVQAFLPPEESGRAKPLLRAGFQRVTSVWQMKGPSGSPRPRFGGEGLGVRGLVSPEQDAISAPGQPEPPSPQPSPPKAVGEGVRQSPPVSLVPYTAGDPLEFETTLLHAHDDSLDCPELHGIRSADEVLAGYRDCAPDTARWYLARVDGKPVGALVLGEGELHFVGVVPEGRGQGVGRALVEEAVARDPQLSLIVDARNIPALRLYRSLGFEVAGSRDVFLRFR